MDTINEISPSEEFSLLKWDKTMTLWKAHNFGNSKGYSNLIHPPNPKENNRSPDGAYQSLLTCDLHNIWCGNNQIMKWILRYDELFLPLFLYFVKILDLNSWEILKGKKPFARNEAKAREFLLARIGE